MNSETKEKDYYQHNEYQGKEVTLFSAVTLSLLTMMLLLTFFWMFHSVLNEHYSGVIGFLR